MTISSLFRQTLFFADLAANTSAPVPIDKWQLFWGASTGACVYILTTSYRYLVDRSFDPKYNAAYATRLVCGIVAGFILAQVSGFFISEGSPWAKVGPGVLALLGGFAAEAVEEVLKRMVAVFMAVVNGTGEQQSKVQLQEQKTNVADQQSKKTAALWQSLSTIPLDGVPPAVVSKLRAIQATL